MRNASTASRSRREAHKFEEKTRSAVAMVNAKERKPIMVEARLIGASEDWEDTTTPIVYRSRKQQWVR
jgi:hypothetical protein